MDAGLCSCSMAGPLLRGAELHTVAAGAPSKPWPVTGIGYMRGEWQYYKILETWSFTLDVTGNSGKRTSQGSAAALPLSLSVQGHSLLSLHPADLLPLRSVNMEMCMCRASAEL